MLSLIQYIAGASLCTAKLRHRDARERQGPTVAAVARSEGPHAGHGPRSRHAKAARNTPPQRDDGSGHARPVSPGALLHARTRRQIQKAGGDTLCRKTERVCGASQDAHDAEH